MNIIKRLKEKYLNSVESIVQKCNSQLFFNQVSEELTEKALFSKELGINREKVCDSEVVVSLTTYGERLYDVYLPIESIMQGTLKPNRIILWVSEDFQFRPLPITLQRQQKRGLEVRYCKDIRSFTKLIPTLKVFPDACIITIDDDLIYKFDLVENLMAAYILEPHYIHANRIHKLVLGDDNKPINYMKWQWNSNNAIPSYLNFLTGVGGVLYPPQSLDNEVFNEEVFLDICKYADDIWFYAMALKKGTMIKKSFTHNPKGEDYILNGNVQNSGLLNVNTKNQCLNDIQLKSVFDRYNLYQTLVK